MSSDAVLDRLTRLHPKVIDLSLGRIEGLLARLGNPETRLAPVVHVAGTNGKGSLVAFLRAILEAAGHRVQVYTSPHLLRFAERIRGVKGVIAEDRLVALLEECERANGAEPITFFEITTAAALLAFAREPADVVLLEVGLGGRLDATNVVARPRLCAITPISLDHGFYLGDTLPGVAAEKAAILKPGVPAVIGPQAPPAARVIARRAARVGAPLMRHRRRGPWAQGWCVRRNAAGMSVRLGDEVLALPLPALAGPHQVENAATAVACAAALGEYAVEPSHLAEGLAAATWPGRLQRLDSGPLRALLPADAELWVDGGHNPAAGAALAAWSAERDDGAPLHLVVGMLDTKDAGGFLAPLAPYATSAVTLTVAGEPAALDAEALAAAATAAGMKARAAPSIEAALALATASARPPRVLVCGSLYLAGQVLAANGTGM